MSINVSMCYYWCGIIKVLWVLMINNKVVLMCVEFNVGMVFEGEIGVMVGW